RNDTASVFVSGTRPREEAGLPTCLGNASTIAHQTTGFRELTQVITRGNSMLDRQCGELIALTEEKRIGGRAPAWTWGKVAKAASKLRSVLAWMTRACSPRVRAATLMLSAARRCWSTTFGPLGHQPTRFDILPNAVHRRQSRPGP